MIGIAVAKCCSSIGQTSWLQLFLPPSAQQVAAAQNDVLRPLVHSRRVSECSKSTQCKSVPTCLDGCLQTQCVLTILWLWFLQNAYAIIMCCMLKVVGNHSSKSSALVNYGMLSTEIIFCFYQLWDCLLVQSDDKLFPSKTASEDGIVVLVCICASIKSECLANSWPCLTNTDTQILPLSSTYDITVYMQVRPTALSYPPKVTVCISLCFAVGRIIQSYIQYVHFELAVCLHAMYGLWTRDCMNIILSDGGWWLIPMCACAFIT
jgi:hypothetical protein